jgi:hypothetical protein
MSRLLSLFVFTQRCTLRWYYLFYGFNTLKKNKNLHFKKMLKGASCWRVGVKWLAKGVYHSRFSPVGKIFIYGDDCDDITPAVSYNVPTLTLSISNTECAVLCMEECTGYLCEFNVKWTRPGSHCKVQSLSIGYTYSSITLWVQGVENITKKQRNS